MPSKTENQQSIVGRIFQELHPSHVLNKQGLVPAIVSGTLIGLMTSILSISFAVLVFSKALPEALPIGIGMALLSNVILHLSSSLTSSAEGIVSHVQSLPPPFLAAMLSSLMAMVPATMLIEEKTAIAVFAILLSSVLTGAFLFIFGWRKFGQLVRFLPAPVVSGFLVSVGVALIFGGISTMTKTSVTLFSLHELFSIDLFLTYLPGVTLATVIWIVTARWKSPLLVPMILGVFVNIFYAVGLGMDLSMQDMMKSGLLLGASDQDQLWQPPIIYLSKIDASAWSLLFSQGGIFATIFLVCLIGSLLTVSAIEFSTGKDLDPDFELKSIGITNIFSGLVGGGFVGYPSATFTVMQQGFGVHTRLPGILSAIIPLMILVSGTAFHGYIPRFVIGGLLIYFGYQFIDQWVIKLLKDTTISDMTTIAAIVMTSLWLGFVPSIAIGIFASASFFLFKYSKISVVRFETTGSSLRSRVTRNAMHHDWLSTHADRIMIFGLHGYIFFGTAHNLLEKIMLRVSDSHRALPDSVVLDFNQVTGMDTSVIQSFQKLLQQLKQKNIALIFAQVPPKYQGLLQKLSAGKAVGSGFAYFDSLDEALESLEDNLIANSDLPPYQSPSLLNVFIQLFHDQDKAETLLLYLQRIELQPGAKLISQGEIAQDLYFLESGRVSTYAQSNGSKPIRLETMVDETMVGELGFYLNQLRTATVIAEINSIVYRLSKNALEQLERNHPAVAIELHKLIVMKTAKRVNLNARLS